MAAKAVALAEASQPAFAIYAHAVVTNASELAEALQKAGVKVLTGGTENHLVMVDLRPHALTGRQAEAALRTAGVTLNRNVIPGDPNGPWYTSGLRLGSAAVTTLGMRAAEMHEVAELIHMVLTATSPGTIGSGPNTGKRSRVQFQLDESVRDRARARVADLLHRHPLYPDIEL
jgi:glycine hydroxymethyltransferase